jgi:hypothetical protein
MTEQVPSNPLDGIPELTMLDAPCWYSSSEAGAWANGYAAGLEAANKRLREAIDARATDETAVSPAACLHERRRRMGPYPHTVCMDCGKNF